jgi:hypothetical protein
MIRHTAGSRYRSFAPDAPVVDASSLKTYVEFWKAPTQVLSRKMCADLGEYEFWHQKSRFVRCGQLHTCANRHARKNL